MVNPVPGYGVTIPYRKTGSFWTACGWHTGQDYAAPKGTRVVAARAGVVKHVNYGSAFGGYQIVVVCADGSQDFYAHMYRRETHNTWVDAGAWVGYVGSEGNSTGPHLHFERHKVASQGWKCSNMENPMLSHILKGTNVDPGKVYVSKLVYKQDDSDSVKRLQERLNGISLSGGTELPITGGYFDKTKAEVKKWQEQKATDKSIKDGSKITDAQADQLFAGTQHTVVHDTEEPDIPTPPDELIFDGFGLWKWYSGKPSGEFVLPPGEWKKLGLREPASGIKAESSEHRLLYLRVELPKGRTSDRVLEVKFVRASGDATAYDSEEYGTKKDSHPYYNVHFEDGDGAGGEWWVKVTGGTDPIKFTTRYAKQHTYYEKKQSV
jgi:Peptidase family M23